MRAFLAFASLVALVGCKEDQKRHGQPPPPSAPAPSGPAASAPAPGPSKTDGARTIDVGAFTVPLPEGMRDGAEIFDAETMKRVLAEMPPGGRVLTTAADDGPVISVGAVQEIIEVSTAMCKTIGKAADSGAIESASVVTGRLGKACYLKLGTGEDRTIQYYVPGKGSMLLVVCMDATDAQCASIALGATMK